MRSARKRAGACFLLLAVATACAQSAPAVSLAEHKTRVEALGAALQACADDRRQCTAERIGADETVTLENGVATRIRLEWLRAGMVRLGAAEGQPRKELLTSLQQHLAWLKADRKTAPAVTRAHGEFAQVLAAREFAPDPEPSWLRRKWNEFLRWLVEALSKSFEAATHAPEWLRFLFEALLFLVPMLLLCVWLLRQAREDRIHPSLRGKDQAESSVGPSTEWIAQAEECARRGEWRKAIHALYWATIAGFEARHAWRRNRTRTPREYLRLLKENSAERAALEEQTRLFEVIWYGYREAGEEDYRRAAQLLTMAEAR